jgi:hypothetical protein
MHPVGEVRGNEDSRSYRLGHPIVCVECGHKADLYASGWRGYRMDEPLTDELPALAFYCPGCAASEFG